MVWNRISADKCTVHTPMFIHKHGRIIVQFQDAHEEKEAKASSVRMR